MDYLLLECYGWIWLSQCADLRLAIENHRNELSELLLAKLKALYTDQIYTWSQEKAEELNFVPNQIGILPPSFGFYPLFPWIPGSRNSCLENLLKWVSEYCRIEKNHGLGGDSDACLQLGKCTISSFTVSLLYLKVSWQRCNREIISE